jgi:glycosyltransferase involved in cell wall biosynthesis
VAGGLADSDYNAAELAELGLRDAVTCPILLDLAEYHQAPATPDPPATPDRTVAAGLGEHPLWLFVGRVAPNKCQHDVIAAFAAYRRLYAPNSHLAVVGAVTSPRYQKALERMVDDLDLAGAVELTGPAPFATLLAYYRRADVFVCLSEHEGFCVPVIEAMELGVPVVGYSAAAVTETVADAGVLLEDKEPLAVATAVHRLLSDPAARETLQKAGRARASAFALPVTSAKWLDSLRRYGVEGSA